MKIVLAVSAAVAFLLMACGQPMGPVAIGPEAAGCYITNSSGNGATLYSPKGRPMARNYDVEILVRIANHMNCPLVMDP